MTPSYTIKTLWLGIAAAAFAILLALLAIQTARIEGFKIWPLSVEGYKAENKRIALDLKSCKDGQVEAAKKQQDVNDATQTRYDALADKVETDEKKLKTAARDATAAYAAAHRVRPEAVGSASSRTDPATEGDDPGIFIGVSDDPLVVITESDLQICSDNSVYAVKAHDWATGLEEK